ncbi:ACT domain-containing protein [Saccharomonospora azurea]|uniref:ACT domain-containing protein n=1 Tax=Saccharomonospora azurea TaxID=40988 RepID=UPI003D91CA8D
MRKLRMDVRPGEYVVARLEPSAAVPPRLLDAAGGFVSVTRTEAEVSIVCPAGVAPDGAVVEAGWRLLTVRGPLEFSLTGIMAALAGELAAAGVSLFAVSTYDTDHVLVKDADLGRAVTALRSAGHAVTGE